MEVLLIIDMNKENFQELEDAFRGKDVAESTMDLYFINSDKNGKTTDRFEVSGDLLALRKESCFYTPLFEYEEEE